MPRLTQDQWGDARAMREAGASLSEVAERIGVDRAAVSRRAKKEGWGDGADIADAIRKKVTEKVTGIVTPCNPKKRAEAIDAEADRRAAVIERHREEWPKVREMLETGREAHKNAEDVEEKRLAFEDLKAAKISSETIKFIQEGERKAWGLDQIVDVTKLTDEQLANVAKGKMPT